MHLYIRNRQDVDVADVLNTRIIGTDFLKFPSDFLQISWHSNESIFGQDASQARVYLACLSRSVHPAMRLGVPNPE